MLHVAPDQRPAERLAHQVASAPGGVAAPILVLDGVSLSFGGVKALASVDLAVQSGDIHAVIGPNGAGKSSLINVISGLYRPDSGRVRIRDKTFTRVPTAQIVPPGRDADVPTSGAVPELERSRQHRHWPCRCRACDICRADHRPRPRGRRAGRSAPTRARDYRPPRSRCGEGSSRRRAALRPAEAGRTRARAGLTPQDHPARRADGGNDRN